MRERINKYISIWKNRDYKKDIPDEVPSQIQKKNLAPSYKAVAMAILNNDHSMQSLGFSVNKSEWYSFLKRIELEERGTIKRKEDLQLTIWDMK